MKLRLALTAFVYAVALSVGALVITGHLNLGSFTGGSEQVAALDSQDTGSAFLLCGGCYNTGYNYNTTYRVTVTVTVTFQPNYCCQYQTYNYNPCAYGCYNNYNYNACSWGCYQQPVYYTQPIVYQPVYRFHSYCGCSY